ncbi:MAG: HD domain-containing protein [Cyclobacteriaceae bacterium]
MKRILLLIKNVQSFAYLLTLFVMANASLISVTVEFVRATLSEAEAGHDWWHTQRVWRNAQHIAAEENVDELVVELSALLHDIADAKFHGGDEEIGPKTALRFLEQQAVD